MRWSTKWKSPGDRTLNTVNGTKRQEEKVPPPLGSCSKLLGYNTADTRAEVGGEPAVTLQLMCVDSADVIYSLFSALLC